jgi:ribosomal protein S4E
MNNSKEQVYWKTKDGRVMLVDDMDEQHAKNALKMMIRNMKLIKEHIQISNKVNPKFEIHGEMAQDHIDTMMQHDYEMEMDIDYQNCL